MAVAIHLLHAPPVTFAPPGRQARCGCDALCSMLQWQIKPVAQQNRAASSLASYAGSLYFANAFRHAGGSLRDPASKQPGFHNEGIHVIIVTKGLRDAGLV